MYTLYENPDSGNCWKVRQILTHLSLPFESVFVDVVKGGPRPEAMMKNTSIGKVPVLELEDGTALCESNAILNFLATDTPYLPSDALERSRVLAWMFFEQNLHEPSIASRRYWVHLAPDSSPRAAQLPHWLESGHKVLDTMNRELEHADFFGSDHYTIADIALFGYTQVAHEGGFDLEPYPAVRAWMDRVREVPGHISMSGAQ